MNIFKRLFSKLLNRNNQHNSNNQNNSKMDENTIRLGHYKSNQSSSDSIRMIRVIANDPKNNNYWFLSDGRRISSSELLYNYVYMETSHDEISTPTKPLVIGDLQGIPEDYDGSQISRNRAETVINQDNLSQPVKTKIVEKIVEKRIELEEQIVNKCETTESKEYSITIKITSNIDFEKLVSSIDILNLDADKVSGYVVTNIKKNSKNNIEKLISDALKNIVNSYKDISEPSKSDFFDDEPESEEPEPEDLEEPKMFSQEEQINSVLNFLENDLKDFENE